MIRVALDGPSGAGKSTVAKALSARLGLVYVDTGALYRTVGYYVRQKGADPKSEAEVTRLLPEMQVELCYRNGEQHVMAALSPAQKPVEKAICRLKPPV